MVRCLFLFVSLAAILIGCSNSSDSTSVGSDSPIINQDSLFLMDSIGVFTGDSCYFFGTIRDIRCYPEGIAITDEILCRISFFNAEGEFLYSTGRNGEGPGEYTYPTRFCRLENGDSFVFDFGDRSVTMLDDSLEFICSYSMHMGLPVKIRAGTDSMVVIKQLLVEFREEQLYSGYRICSMNAYTGEEGAVYREHFAEMGEDEVDIKPWYSFFTADAAGNVYLADYDTDVYAIDVLSPAGDTLRRIEMEPEVREEFDIETQQLEFLPITMPLTTNAGVSTMKITEPEIHPYVTALDIDCDGNIWVRRMGLADSEYWDVVSQEGELLRRVVLFADTTGAAAYPSLHVSPHGLVATRVEHEVERFYLVGN